MVAAALILLVSGTGVGVGWQPMPDDSPRYEYVVQIEPEMLQALAEGQSIPIVSEVPEDAQPIGRIRIVVGRGDLPRERLVMQMKPTDELGAEGRSTGIELTQYTESAAPRYATPPPAAMPYGAAPVGAFDPYTQAPPTTTADGGGAWNADRAAANPLRTAGMPDGSAAAGATGWNGAIAEVADASAARGPLDRVGAGIDQVTEPIREGLDRLDDRFRTAADNLGDRTQGLFDQLRPGRAGGLMGRAADPPAAMDATAAAAAPGWNGGDAAPAATGWNGGGAVDAATVAAPAGGEEPRGSWNNEVAADAGVANGAGTGFAGSSPELPAAPPLISGSAGPVRGADSDPWANAADPRLRSAASGATGATGSTSDTGGRGSAALRGTAPLFPQVADAAAGQTGQTGPGLGAASGLPAITTGMLAQPASRPLDGVDPSATVADGASAVSSPVLTPAAGSGPLAATPPTAASPGFDRGVAGGSTGAAGQVGADQAAAGSEARHKAAVILAWVLLSGSAAGNIYLFWSYLDVRTKYRALVRKTARAVGSRFSAA